MHFDLVLSGGELASSEGIRRADIGILNGKVEAIGDLAGSSSQETVDVSGLTLLPGIIDTQVHFREPGMTHKEDIESGTRAAILGGVTTVFEMPNTIPPTTTVQALVDKLERANGRAWCEIAFFVGAALDNLDDLGDLEQLPGTPGIKLFMGSSTGTLLVPDDDNVRRVLANGRRPVAVHSEDTFRLAEMKSSIENPSVADHPRLRDSECARLCTERLLRLARETGRPVHILHLSTEEEIPLILDARAAGVDASAEVTPQHLWFDDAAYERQGTLVQMNPPIRSARHRDALRAALKNGFFTMFGSDHAPHTLEEKRQAYPASPSGMPGVQTLAPALLTLGRKLDLFDLPAFVRLACENPALRFGIVCKGRIAPGFDADIAAFDLGADYVFEERDVAYKCGWSPFVGERFTARPVHTLLRGEFAVRDGAVVGEPRGAQPGFDWKTEPSAAR